MIPLHMKCGGTAAALRGGADPSLMAGLPGLVSKSQLRVSLIHGPVTAVFLLITDMSRVNDHWI